MTTPTPDPWRDLAGNMDGYADDLRALAERVAAMQERREARNRPRTAGEGSSGAIGDAQGRAKLPGN